MDPTAALRDWNFEDLSAWLDDRGGFAPDWSKYPKQTAEYRRWIREVRELHDEFDAREGHK